MTIKQQGGIFGRNPTFNDVTVEENLSVNGSITGASFSSSGNMTFGDDDKAIFGDASDLQIYHDGSASYIEDAGQGNLLIKTDGSKIALQDGSGNNMLQARTNGAVELAHLGVNKLATTSSGVSITGNVIMASGNGIDFSATSGTGTSELFDDYEEGSFSPVIEGTSSAGTATYSRQAGVYTKVGNCVNFWVDIIYSSGSGSGNLKITGLPYTSSSTTMIKTYFAHTYDISLTAGNIAAATLSLNATQLLIKQLPTGGGATSSVAYDAAGEIQITGSYFV